MNVEEQLITLIKGVSDIGAKVDTIQKSMDEMRDMAKTISSHSTRIEQLEDTLKRGASKLDKLEDRVEKLERAEGEKAKETIATVAKYVLVAIVGAILSCTPVIINSLGK